jgi:hypothetical protein
MIRRPIQDYFFFGTAVRYLQDIKTGWQIADAPEGLYVAGNLRHLLRDIEVLDLVVTARTDAAYALQQLQDEFSSADETATLTEKQARRLAESVAALRPTLEAELRASYAYSVTPKRVDVVRLIEAPESLFPPQVFAKLPEIAQFDLAEAARCIAFELPTAAAFHLMRAVEAVLRAFYAGLVRRGRRARMWSDIIVDLRKRRAGKGHLVLLNHLDHIRSSFRNPTQHPDARYDSEEVQELWALCVDVLSRMATR